MSKHKEAVKSLNLKTGDIVLFSGRCKVARLIQILTLCRWSHVGMVIIDGNYDTPLVYESTHNDRVPGLDIKKRTQGVQVVKLTDRLKGYHGEMAVMRLLDNEFNDVSLRRLDSLRKEFKGKPFEKNIRQAFMSMFKWYRLEKDITSLFCSELVAQCYIELGLLDIHPSSNNYTPADFARKRLKLLSGHLSDPFIIK